MPLTKPTSVLFILILFVISQVPLLSGASAVDTDYEELYAAALSAQHSLDRQRLDSISDLIIAMGDKLDNREYYNNGLAFKSEAMTRVHPMDAISLAQEALIYFEEISESDRCSRLYNTLGHAYSNTGEPQTAITNYKRALEYSQTSETKHTKKEVRFRAGILYNMGFTSIRVGNLDVGAEFLYQSLEVIQPIGDSSILSSIYVQLGNIKLLRGYTDQALTNFKKALELTSKACYSCERIALSSIGQAFHEKGTLDSALHYYNLMIPLNRENNDMFSLCVGLYNRSELYVLMDKPQKAIENANELLTLAKERGFRNFEVNAYDVLANAHLKMDQVQHAQAKIELAILSLDSLADYNIKSSVYKLASEIYERNNDFKKALVYQRNYQIQSDHILNEESAAQIDELIVKYESKEKEAEIKMLEQEQALNEVAFEQKILAGIGVLVILGLCGGLYIQHVNKKRLMIQKQKDSMEQRLLRSQMNPHFIFNAISSIQTYLFEKSEVETALNYLSKFATLMRQILENSREEFIPLADEISALNNYLELQQLRYNNSFRYDISLDQIENSHNLYIPPLITQPFVENAIEHGMIYLRENGMVNIHFSCKDDKLILRIDDNGGEQNTLQIATANRKVKKKSLATLITRERLSLLSKSSNVKYHMMASQLSTGGTSVTIELPKKSML